MVHIHRLNKMPAYYVKKKNNNNSIIIIIMLIKRKAINNLHLDHVIYEMLVMQLLAIVPKYMYEVL